jgi:hypothetical protein
MKLVDISDGTSNTILTVEVNDDAAVIWTKPDDLDIAAGDVLKKILGHYDGGFIIGIADGSVRFIRATIDPKILQTLSIPPSIIAFRWTNKKSPRSLTGGLLKSQSLLRFLFRRSSAD